MEGMFSPNRGFSLPYFDLKLVMTLVLFIVFEWLHRFRVFGLDIGTSMPQVLRWSLYLMLLTLWLVYANFDEQAFIYFDF